MGMENNLLDRGDPLEHAALDALEDRLENRGDVSAKRARHLTNSIFANCDLWEILGPMIDRLETVAMDLNMDIGPEEEE
jgi:hypothetical protein